MNLRTKTTLCILLTGLIVGVTTYAVAYNNTQSTLKNNYVEKLTAIRESKVRLVSDYFQTLKRQVSTLAQSPTTKAAANDFVAAFQSYVKPEDTIDRDVIATNRKSLYNFYNKEYKQQHSEDYSPQEASRGRPNPTGSAYDEIHQKYNDFFSTYVTGFQFADVLLVDAKTADIIYSYQKNDNFAQSLLTNLSQGSHLARAFIEIKRSIDPYMIKFVDFHHYASADNKPASFLAAPVYDKGKKIAILLFQVSIDKLDETMTGSHNWSGEGLGETGESYIVGTDYKMRNNSRFLIEDPDNYYQQLQGENMLDETIQHIKENGTTILYQKVVTDAVEEAIQHNSGTKEIKGYRGLQVLSSYTPIKIDDVEWTLLTEINIDEMYGPIRDLNQRTIISLLLLLIPLFIFAGIISKQILNPLHRLMGVMEKLGQGIFTERVAVTSNDEIGVLAKRFNESSAELERMANSVKSYSAEQVTLKEKIEVMTHLNTTDALTGIYNRNKFEQVLQTLLQSDKKMAGADVIVMFDIDNFKLINDTFGHDFGDKMLLSVTEIVQENHRERDVFARWGGDEFMLLLPSTRLVQALKFVERVRQNIESSPQTKSVYITCSFGVTELEADDVLETVFKRVDTALYDAKEAGKNCIKVSGDHRESNDAPKLYLAK